MSNLLIKFVNDLNYEDKEKLNYNYKKFPYFIGEERDISVMLILEGVNNNPYWFPARFLIFSDDGKYVFIPNWLIDKKEIK